MSQDFIDVILLLVLVFAFEGVHIHEWGFVGVLFFVKVGVENDHRFLQNALLHVDFDLNFTKRGFVISYQQFTACV